MNMFRTILCFFLEYVPTALNLTGVVIHDISTHNNIQAAKDVLTTVGASVAQAMPEHAQASNTAAAIASGTIDAVADLVKQLQAAQAPAQAMAAAAGSQIPA
jgi:RNA polymerase-interacting CarD/CdnL/TRCF family regulator